MGYAPAKPPLERPGRPLPPQRDRRGQLGQGPPARQLAGALWGAELQRQAYELQAYGPVPGAGLQLGLCHAENPFCRPAHQRAEPVRLHRGRHRGLRQGGGPGLPCGRGQGHGGLGQGERCRLRHGGSPHPLDRGRLRQVCGAGDPPGPPL